MGAAKHDERAYPAPERDRATDHMKNDLVATRARLQAIARLWEAANGPHLGHARHPNCIWCVAMGGPLED